MPVRIVRLCRLYNEPARPARRAIAGKPARKARPATKGVFDAGKTFVFQNLVLRDPRQPLIPGTRRSGGCAWTPLGMRSLGTGEDEIARVKTELSNWREQQLQAKADAATARHRRRVCASRKRNRGSSGDLIKQRPAGDIQGNGRRAMDARSSAMLPMSPYALVRRRDLRRAPRRAGRAHWPLALAHPERSRPRAARRTSTAARPIARARQQQERRSDDGVKDATSQAACVLLSATRTVFNCPSTRFASSAVRHEPAHLRL